MSLSLPCRNRWCPELQPCPRHPIVPFVSSPPMPPGWDRVSRETLQAAGHICQLRVAGVCIGRATEVHHVIPRIDGGDESPFNLRAACRPCHLSVGGREASA